MNQPFWQQKIALLTQHGKERVINPVLESALGCTVEHIHGYDTDVLGTFTRDIPRDGTQLEAARKKARMGMTLSGLPVGVASEGSFGPDPFTGMFTWNVEMVVLLDDRTGLEVVGISQAAAQCGDVVTADWNEATRFATRYGFPQHQLVLRSQRKDTTTIHKGIADWDQLKTLFDTVSSEPDTGKVFIESDLRAHANPTRMENIRRATVNLAARLNSHCPACQAPGYWATKAVAGLPCALCSAPTKLPKGEVWQCVACDHQEARLKPDTERAEAKHCQLCNP